MSSAKGASRTVFPLRRVLGGAAVFVLFTGMLFWTKLRIVSDIPRSAYAVPPGEEDPAGDDCTEAGENCAEGCGGSTCGDDAPEPDTDESEAAGD